MNHEKTIHIFVEITKTDQRELVFHQDRVTGRQIKEAAKVPLDDELAAKHDGKLKPVANDETITIKDGEKFVVTHKVIDIHIVVEITKTDHRKLEFHQHQVTGRQIKEAAGLPLDTDLAARREGKLELVTNDELITIKNGEHFVVLPPGNIS